MPFNHLHHSSILCIESSLHIAINASVSSSLQPAIFETFRYPGVETEAQLMLENGSENRFVLTALRTVPERFWNHLICGSGLERNRTEWNSSHCETERF